MTPGASSPLSVRLARAIVDHPRNVPDSILKRLPKNGGVVMVTFVPGFLSPEVARAWEAQEAEEARVAIRNVRRDANTHLKDMLKKHDVPEDEEKRAQDEVQKLTDKAIADIDRLVAEKEKELMAV